MRAKILLLLAVPCCATIGSSSGGDVNLPTSGVGPFRKLLASEERGVVPFVLDDASAHYREPAVLAAGDPSTEAVFLYAVGAQGAQDVIVRTRADDGRSFYGTALDTGHDPAVVLTADAAWEGSSLGGPSVVRIGGRTFLYYAAQGGIGLAESDDGLTFTKQPMPVLAPDPTVTWETSAPAAPSVAVYPDGRIRMLYAAGVDIGEAESSDGVAWTRLDADPSTPGLDPVLVPSAPVDVPDGAHGPFDTGQVGDPCLLPRVTPAGRLQVRVLYTGYDQPPGAASRESTIGFAARYGDAGPLVRQAVPVFSLGKHEAAPALFEWSGSSMLYVQMDETAGGAVYPAIGAGYAPAQLTLPPPAEYPSGP